MGTSEERDNGRESTMDPYEEHYQTSGRWSWVIILAGGVILVAWGLFHLILVNDRTRQFDFGALPDTPGESVYSTGTHHPKAAPLQIAPLPEANRHVPSPDERSTPTARDTLGVPK